MSERLMKYTLIDCVQGQTRAMHADAQILSVNNDFTMWVMCDDSKPVVLRRFRMCTSQVALLNPPKGRYVGATARGMQIFEMEIPR